LNKATGTTFIEGAGANLDILNKEEGGALRASTAFGHGVHGSTWGAGNGVTGVAVGPSASYGVVGTSVIIDENGTRQGNGVGVLGQGTFGVRGESNYLGVYGQGGTYGVFGYSQSTGVWGDTFGNSFTAIGVRGAAVNGTGVVGHSTNGTGVEARSTEGFGVDAFSQNDTAVFAVSGTSNGLYARSDSNSHAAFFDGSIYVNGEIVTPSFKSAVVAHPDGSHRAVYGIASPESWLEDFGEGKLNRGQVAVDIDPDLAALVGGDSYQVFLTPYGDCKGLYVTDRTSVGFRVSELQGGTSNIEFGYRIVAKRHDASARRLQRVELPAPPPRRDTSKLAARPELPEPPQQPELPSLPDLPPLLQPEPRELPDFREALPQ
jgi:hypothetical protein